MYRTHPQQAKKDNVIHPIKRHTSVAHLLAWVTNSDATRGISLVGPVAIRNMNLLLSVKHDLTKMD